jgi:hypothetical protein
MSAMNWRTSLLPLIPLALVGFATASNAGAGAPGKLAPTSLFVQAGFAEHGTQSYVLGATWNWAWRRQYSFGTVSGFHEASFGRWITERAGVHGSAWATQVGVTPVLRLQPASWGYHWFAEAGIGANVILPIFRDQKKTFSTKFNFGDHLAVGRLLGPDLRHEVIFPMRASMTPTPARTLFSFDTRIACERGHAASL